MTDRLLARRVARVSGSTIAVWRTDTGWAIVCETHEYAIAPQTSREVDAWKSQSHEWCPECKRL